MTKIADITFRDNKFHLSGNLNFANVMSVYKKSLMQLAKCPEFNFDFSQLKSSDSSGIALVIEWVKLARRKKKPIHFHYLSSDLMSLAKAASLDGIIDGK